MCVVLWLLLWALVYNLSERTWANGFNFQDMQSSEPDRVTVVGKRKSKRRIFLCVSGAFALLGMHSILLLPWSQEKNILWSRVDKYILLILILKLKETNKVPNESMQHLFSWDPGSRTHFASQRLICGAGFILTARPKRLDLVP